jgi:hypothetical protein
MTADEKLFELHENGYCVLRAHFPRNVVDACRHAFWPIPLTYVKDNGHVPNRGPNRHFVPMPFEPPCYAPEFFFDSVLLEILRKAMDDRIVADQWGCDMSLSGSIQRRCPQPRREHNQSSTPRRLKVLLKHRGSGARPYTILHRRDTPGSSDDTRNTQSSKNDDADADRNNVGNSRQTERNQQR